MYSIRIDKDPESRLAYNTKYMYSTKTIIYNVLLHMFFLYKKRKRKKAAVLEKKK